MKRALLSVYETEKVRLLPFAKALVASGVDLYASSGTARFLKGEGVPVKSMEDLTGIGSLLGGRLKTLHPMIHAGLLAKDTPEDQAVLEEMGAPTFDYLISSLYPFAEGLRAGKPEGEQVELIDVGGPSMIRGAAKNFARVTVVMDAADYPRVMETLATGGPDLALRRELSAKAFRHLSAYDAAVASFLGGEGEALPLAVPFRRALRYGENPHQEARLYGPLEGAGPDLFEALTREGKTLSTNNLLDAEAALFAVMDLPEPAVVIVKHGTPCGAATGTTLKDAYQRALETDKEAAFGGIAALSSPLDKETAEVATSLFLEVLIAPGADAQALEVLAKKSALRLILVPRPWKEPQRRLRSVGGNLISEQADRKDARPEEWTLAAGTSSPELLKELGFAWTLCRHVKSNAIVVAKGGAALGIGGGQVSRVRAAKDALEQAGEGAVGAVLASDGFIPFPDVVEAARHAGVRAIVEPGGSKGDPLVIEAAQAAGITLYFTGIRHFRH